MGFCVRSMLNILYILVSNLTHRMFANSHSLCHLAPCSSCINLLSCYPQCGSEKVAHLLTGPSCGAGDTPGCPVEFGQTWRSKRRSAYPACSSASSSPPHRPPCSYTRLVIEGQRIHALPIIKRKNKRPVPSQLFVQFKQTTQSNVLTNNIECDLRLIDQE